MSVFRFQPSSIDLPNDGPVGWFFRKHGFMQTRARLLEETRRLTIEGGAIPSLNAVG